MSHQKQGEEAMMSSLTQTGQHEEGEEVKGETSQFTLKNAFWHGGSAYDAWFSCASNQVNMSQKGVKPFADNYSQVFVYIISFAWKVIFFFNESQYLQISSGSWLVLLSKGVKDFLCQDTRWDSEVEHSFDSSEAQKCKKDVFFWFCDVQVAQVLLTLPYSFAQLGVVSGIVFQVFYGLLGSYTAYLISVLYIEYRSRKEKENVSFKNHVIQVRPKTKMKKKKKLNFLFTVENFSLISFSSVVWSAGRFTRSILESHWLGL